MWGKPSLLCMTTSVRSEVSSVKVKETQYKDSAGEGREAREKLGFSYYRMCAAALSVIAKMMSFGG